MPGYSDQRDKFNSGFEARGAASLLVHLAFLVMFGLFLGSWLDLFILKRLLKATPCINS
jgi:hypothetical protein